MKTFLSIILFTFIFSLSFSQDKIGKIDLLTVFQEDPDTLIKNKKLREYADNVYQQLLPDLIKLNDQYAALDTNNKMYNYYAEDIWSKIQDYQNQYEELRKQKLFELYFTKDVSNDAYWSIFLRESLSCLLIYYGDEFLGSLYNTEEFANKLNQNPEKLKTELIEYYDANESNKYYDIIILNEEDDNYLNELLHKYLKYYGETVAIDYSNDLIEKTYK